MKNNKKKIVNTIVLALLMSNPVISEAGSEIIVSNEKKPVFNVYFYDQNEHPTNMFNPNDPKSEYTLSDNLKQGIANGMQYWADILGAKSINPVDVIVMTKDEPNAYANNINLDKGKITVDNYTKWALQKGMQLPNITQIKNFKGCKSGFLELYIGKNISASRNGSEHGWYIDTESVIPTNEQAADFIGTIRHEMAHALGILCYREPLEDARGNDLQDRYGTYLYKFSDGSHDTTEWNMHLMDQNGNMAKPGMEIITSAEFNHRHDKDPNLKTEDFFIVDNYKDNAINDFDNPLYGKAFFIGKNVSEVLNGAKFNDVDGLPITTWEDNAPEFSHINTNGMMGHVSYSNYTNFLEAELAVMQDLGYQIDRKNYYGYSMYDNNKKITIKQGFSARSEDGKYYLPNEYNTSSLGVGLHIYGSNNYVTQAGDILTAGTGAVGIRVDGANNLLVIDKDTKIHADGKRGIGVLVAYGGNHVINQLGDVSALGEKGNALQFDFGSSTNGAADEYRGSYIRYIRRTNDGAITEGRNFPFNSLNRFYPKALELRNELVSEYNIKGTVSGQNNAIYIGKNAFVKDINILPGAAINGDITSDWKHFDTEEKIYDASRPTMEKLVIQYDYGAYDYDEYIPPLVTNLNFANNMFYNGKISGNDNLRIRVESDKLTYTGVADVVSVKVDKGATLLGGTYKLNDMTDKMASGFMDNKTGRFVNNGTIGALPPKDQDSFMKIDGDLISKGAIYFSANGEYQTRIDITGVFIDKGTTLIIDEQGKYKPNHVYGPAVSQNGQGLDIKYLNQYARKPLYQTAMLTAKLHDNNLVFTLNNNLGELTDEQDIALKSINSMYEKLPDEKQEELLDFYNHSADKAKSILSDIIPRELADNINLVQKNTVMDTVVKQIDNTTDSNDFWVTTSRDWRNIGHDKKAISNAISIGKNIADNHIDKGFVLTQNTINYDGISAKNKTHDCRIGVYQKWNKHDNESYAYADIGYEKINSKRILPSLQTTAQGKTNGYIVEVGGQYKQKSKEDKIWNITPYVNGQISYYKQGKYEEAGAGVYNYQIQDFDNLYCAIEPGVELKCELENSEYGISIGYKNIVKGTSPKIEYTFADDKENIYNIKGKQDSHFLKIGADLKHKLSSNWQVKSNVSWEKGQQEKNLSWDLSLNYEW